MKYLEYTYNNRVSGDEQDVGIVEATPDNLIALHTQCPFDCSMTVYEFEATAEQAAEIQSMANITEEGVRLFS